MKKYIPKEVQEKRQEICDTCPSQEKEEGRCKTCGCVLEWKIPLVMSDCPEQKWDMDQESLKSGSIRSQKTDKYQNKE